MPAKNELPKFPNPEKLRRATDANLTKMVDKAEWGEPSHPWVIAPENALEMLQQRRGTHNRPVSHDAVVEYTGSMVEGRYGNPNGETIIIDDRGLICEGQHRLESIYKSGKTIISYIVFGVPHDLFKTMGIGRSKTAAHLLKTSGVKNYAECAAATQIAERIATNTMTSRIKIGPQRIHDLYFEKHMDVRHWVSEAKAIRKANGMPVGATMALLYTFDKLDPDLVAELVPGWSGAGWSPRCMPMAQAMTHIAKIKNDALRVHDTLRMALVIRAWNAMRDHKPTIRTDWRPKDPFPVPH